ncbi:hypothetical protein H7J88_09025 [Mycolicibacterium flavescens]|uniref:hypothetical protein n=1 Tax=Mycolicibacterium flavescens TaxID=1776 RepID=UPI000AF534B3|nr:hypothetical protein [Mycolicibacterium flavescens]MCV7279792.1 hypothetical protein [Mycolicibacterium flavescens]
MNGNWISRLARRLARLFAWQPPVAYTDYVDRDAERMARELEAIKLRFPHHA